MVLRLDALPFLFAVPIHKAVQQRIRRYVILVGNVFQSPVVFAGGNSFRISDFS